MIYCLDSLYFQLGVYETETTTVSGYILVGCSTTTNCKAICIEMQFLPKVPVETFMGLGRPFLFRTDRSVKVPNKATIEHFFSQIKTKVSDLTCVSFYLYLLTSSQPSWGGLIEPQF